MNLRIIPQLTTQHFYDMEALELQFYDAEFITPPEESALWQILIYAGERGKTANVGLTIENLTITELD